MKPLVALAGYKGAGKDTAGLALAWLGWERHNFADRLKSACAEAFDLSPSSLEDPAEKDRRVPLAFMTDYNASRKLAAQLARSPAELAVLLDQIDALLRDQRFFTRRELLQFVGTEVGRAIDPDFWVNRFDPPRDRPVYCTDARLQNERAAIRYMGGILVLVTRPGHEPGQHLTERSLGEPDDYDLVLANTGTPAELRRELVSGLLPFLARFSTS